jgi:hypothetical protein
VPTAQSVPEPDPRGSRPSVHSNGHYQQGDRRMCRVSPYACQSEGVGGFAAPLQ